MPRSSSTASLGSTSISVIGAALLLCTVVGESLAVPDGVDVVGELNSILTLSLPFSSNSMPALSGRAEGAVIDSIWTLKLLKLPDAGL